MLVVARGEAVRNFLYSDTLPALSKKARVTLLSAIDDDEILAPASPYVEQVLPLKEEQENLFLTSFRYTLHMAHMRWMWTEAFKFHWFIHTHRPKKHSVRLQRRLGKLLALPLANRSALENLTPVERHLSYTWRTTHYYDDIFTQLKPDLIFNCSQIHGEQSNLPTRIANQMGIPTAVFLFSWDNLTSRSRIFVPYDYYLCWNEAIKQQLLEIYPEIQPEQVHVTGTPQFDFHFKAEFWLSREELCGRMGIDPERPYILYTTGMDRDFGDEHRIVEGVIQYLRAIDLVPKPQLVVRTYIKGTSPDMLALAERGDPDVIFPTVQWESKWTTPLYEDLAIYTSLLKHCALGINAASTVSLELMIHDKPVINLGFEPPGSNLPEYARFARHVDYEHYRPVAQSGAVMLARSMDDLLEMIYSSLTDPDMGSGQRKQFINKFFDKRLDGNSGQRVAEELLRITRNLT